MGQALIAIRRQADGITTVEMRGELDVGSVQALRAVLADVVTKHRPQRLDVDLKYVTFMDSVGVGALVAAHTVARDAGTVLAVTNPGPFVRRLLHTLGLCETFGVPDCAVDFSGSAPTA
ncbi:MAG TPA: STAS domain-containing protein [Pilimelia sp.]|nr:STAS domain-containing protein [Pilimelia sp.]